MHLSLFELPIGSSNRLKRIWMKNLKELQLLSQRDSGLYNIKRVESRAAGCPKGEGLVQDAEFQSGLASQVSPGGAEGIHNYIYTLAAGHQELPNKNAML